MTGMFKGLFKGLLVVLIVGFFIYYLSYNDWINKGFDDLGTKYNDEELEEKNDNKPSIDYKKYYERVNFGFLEENFGSEFYDMYYSNEEFSNSYYLFVSVINLINKNIITECNYSREFNAVEIEWKVNEIFGNVDFKKESFETKDKHLSIKYNENVDTFIVTTNACSGYDFKNGGIYTTAVDYSVSNDYLIIEEKPLYLDYSYDNNGNLVFNYHGGINKENLVVANNIESVDLKKIPSIKLLFKKNNDTYNFVKIQK